MPGRTGPDTVIARRLIVPNTETNLTEAFAGESQANRKYLAFAKKAEQEGYPNVARLFRTAAEAETIRTLGHFAAMDGIKSTAENLKAAIDGETYEHTQMYPPMLKQAEADKHRAKRMFGLAGAAVAVHAKLYKLALEAIQQGKNLTETAFYLCPVCGLIEMGRPPESRPICGAKRESSFRCSAPGGMRALPRPRNPDAQRSRRMAAAEASTSTPANYGFVCCQWVRDLFCGAGDDDSGCPRMAVHYLRVHPSGLRAAGIVPGLRGPQQRLRSLLGRQSCGS